MALNDPVERVIAEALEEGGWSYRRDHPARLDFYLPSADLHIECKRFPTTRIAEQMSRVPNVIAVQGLEAALWLARLLARGQ